jgi:hypothetical protein
MDLIYLKEHSSRISFVYADGTLHKDQMRCVDFRLILTLIFHNLRPLRSLGLYGGKERLPSIAFNTREHSQVILDHILNYIWF